MIETLRKTNLRKHTCVQIQRPRISVSLTRLGVPFLATFALGILTIPALAEKPSSKQKQPAKMQTALDLQAAVYPSLYEGVENVSAGAIYFPDTVLTYELSPELTSTNSVVREWESTHRFIVVPFSIAVQPAEDRSTKAVNVTMALADIGQPRRQSIVHDIFPATRFKKAPASGSVALAVNAEGKFHFVPNLNGSMDANVAFAYVYSPAYAQVLSGKGSGHAFWKFSSSQDSYPAGDIPLKVVLAVPRTYNERELVATFDVRVDFSRKFLWGDFATANFETLFQLP